MGLSALTMKGWKNNPWEQGKWNFYAALFGIIFGTIINLLLGEKVLNITYFGVMGIFLLWGVISLVIGILLGGPSDKKEHTKVLQSDNTKNL